MKMMKKLLALLLVFAMIVPAQAATDEQMASDGEAPLQQTSVFANQTRRQAQPESIQHPSKAEIVTKRQAVTSSQTIFSTKPSVDAPYATGNLTDEFLETGLTYLNYIRFVAGLPEVTLDEALNLEAQHGAVLLAAIDQLTHYPYKPADMDDAFYEQGYAATTSSNISYRRGYNPLAGIKNSIQGCMNDNSSLLNLTTVGHRRWLLYPTLGKVGFGYAETGANSSYTVTKVFDDSGAGCTYDFISWPAAGNHPTDLFHPNNPWSITLNTSVFQTVSADSVRVSVIRESDGTQWIFDGTTGQPNTTITPYLVVDNQGYGLPNCIIFHPGTSNVDAYEGIYSVNISGIFYRDGSPAELNYTVDFFDVVSACPGHNYALVVTAPTCNNQGYTTYTCSVCGGSYKSDYVDALDHDWGEWYIFKEPTCNISGEKRRDCNRCDAYQWYYFSPSGHNYIPTVTAPTCTEGGYTTYTCQCGNSYIDDYVDPLGHEMGRWVTTQEATCTQNGEKRSDCKRCDYYEIQVITSDGHNHIPTVTAPTCTEGGYTTYTCQCGNSYIDDYVDPLGHEMGRWVTTQEATCTQNGEKRSDCKRCDYYEIQVITSDGHNHIPTVTAPTCTEGGYTTYTCQCGDSFVGNYINSLGHDHQYTSAILPSCTVDGFEIFTCSRCGDVVKETLPASGHHYGDDRICDDCGYTAPGGVSESALQLPTEEFAGQDTVWIEGLPYPVLGEGEKRYVEMPEAEEFLLVTYTYHEGDGQDVHTQYPTGMKVYLVKDGEITHIPEFDDLLQYSGASIRITGKKGIRMITSIAKDKKAALTGKGLAGYTVMEYGTVLCFANEIPEGDGLVLGRSYARSNYAYKKNVADPVFATTKDSVQYTNVLVGFSLDQCKDDIAMRPYIILKNAAGEQFTIYGGTIYRSIGYIAYQNRSVFQPKTASYNYVWEIIHHVYGDKYDADYKG